MATYIVPSRTVPVTRQPCAVEGCDTPTALAALDAAHRERMDACECPSCIPPRIGDLLSDVLAEMRRREGR